MIGVIFPFMVPPTNPFPFLLMLCPLYINIHDYILGFCLITTAIIWPWSSGQIDLAVRVLTIINSVYIISSSNRK